MRVRGLSLIFSLLAMLAAAATMSVAQPPVQAPTILHLDFAGLYSQYRPGATVNGSKLPNFSGGFGGQFALSAGRWTSVVVDASHYSNSSASATGLAFGLQVRKNFWRVAPYGEAMAGVQHFSPKNMRTQNTPTYLFGGGVDVRINSRFSVRPFAVSYVNAEYSEYPGSVQKHDVFNGVRIQAGLVYHLNLRTGTPVLSAQCSVVPAAVEKGQPVTVKVQTSGIRSKKRLIYSYTASSGTITENGDSASIDTTGLENGSYHVTARVENPNNKGSQIVRCETMYQVGPLPEAKPAESAPAPGTTEAAAPTPAETKPEEAKPAETAPAETPASKPAEEAAPVNPPAAAPAAPAAEVVSAPSPAATAKAKPAAHTEAPAVVASRRDQPRKYGSVFFHRDVKRPARVDNEAKGKLDRFADLLAASPDAKAVVVGSAARAEGSTAERTQRAAQRAVNTKQYLSQEKGIDPQRIEVRTGSAADKAAELWLLPPGTSVSERGTARVDEERVKAVPRVVLRPNAKKAAESQAPKPKPAVRQKAAHKQKWHEK